MRFSSRLVSLALALTAASFHLPAQEDPCLRRTVPVSVTTEDRKRILGLTSANFRGKFRAQPVEIISTKYDTEPRRIVILLDVSGSMHYAWSIELTVARSLASSAVKDSFAVLTFADRVDYRIGFGLDSKTVVDGLVRLAGENVARGRTALFDALVAALDMLRPVKMGDAIYLISDGDDNASRSHPGEVMSLLLASGVRVFTLAVTTVRTPSWLRLQEGVGTRDPQEIIEATGGDSLTFLVPVAANPHFDDVPLELKGHDRETLSSAAFALSREISEFYTVEVKLPKAVEKAQDWHLEVVVPEPEKIPHPRIVYPHRLAPCP